MVNSTTAGFSFGHNHHNHCFHIIKHCSHCDIAYCTSCKREWGGYTWTYTTTPQFYCGTNTTSAATNTITTDAQPKDHPHN